MLIADPDTFEALDEAQFEFLGHCSRLKNPVVVEFCSGLSKAILKNNEAKAFPDLITFGFFCRKSNINRALAEVHNSQNRLGWGTSVHITPSNIPMNFAFSFLISFLAGNSNVVRIPSKESPQVELFLKLFEELASQEEFKDIGNQNVFIRTHRGSSLLDKLVGEADALIIWGGNETVQTFRTKNRKAKSIEISFPDKISSVVIEARSYLSLTEKEQDALTTGFFNDTLLVDQNACSSPSKVFWLGGKSDIEKAKDLFWGKLEHGLKTLYELHPSSRMDKMMDIMKSNIRNSGALWRIDPGKDLWVIPLSDKAICPEDIKGRFGCFFEKDISKLQELIPFLSTVEQTVSYHGEIGEELRKLLLENAVRGVDRIVPIGQALDMGFDWDGHNLLSTLSREILLA